MASRLFARAALPATRRVATNAPRVARRRMATSHGESKSSDTAWMIGSAAVFGPLIAYLFMGSSKDIAHAKPHNAADDPHRVPQKGDLPAPEVPEPKNQGMTDSEGTTATPKEIASSISKSTNEDSPRDALASEAAGKGEAADTSSPLTPDVDPTAEGAPEAKVEKREPKKGTFQKEEDKGSRPTDMGDARAAARQTAQGSEKGNPKETQAPKKAKEEDKPESSEEKKDE
ncbi:hypothetical protein PENSPDRAFT_749870 [Peniophora sp. CONT]|nr:hypothetical protein PENSPDRAFT_749870 [Peniophora sp. CONT]